MRIKILFFQIFLSSVLIFSQGQNWEIISYQSSYDIESYENKLYLLDTEGLKTSADSGKTWSLIYSEIGFTNLVFDKNGILYASYSDIYKSTDKGYSWEITSLRNLVAKAMEVDSNNTLWVGSRYYLYKSSDQGASWDSTDFGYVTSLSFNSSKGVLNTSWGLFTTTDEGNTWDTLLQTHSWQAAIIDQSNNIFCVGNQPSQGTNKLLRTTDLGNTWTTIYDTIEGYQLTKLDTSIYLTISFPDSKGLYKGSENGALLENLGVFNVYSKIFLIMPYILMANEDGLFRYDPNYIPNFGINHFPLNIGNTWQYLRETYLTKFTTSINADSIIGDKKYYLYEWNYWLRYDPVDLKLYIRLNDSDYVHNDYTKRINEIFQRTNFNGTTINARVISYGPSSIFDSTKLKWGIYYSFPSSSYSKTYFEGVGETSTYIGFPGNTSAYGIIRAKLIYGLDTVKLSDHVKPTISFNPLLTTTTKNNSITVGTSHPYQNNLIGTRFIDSVCMQSIYKNGNDTIFNPPISGSWNQVTSFSEIDFSLDTSLINSGYQFLYRIIANDLGIVSEYSYSPDSGYYNLIYSQPSGVNEENEISEFKLLNNYPNPFNSFTTIDYAIANREFVSLKVYDVLGREIQILVEEEKTEGTYQVVFDASELASGIYIYKMSAGKFSQSKKLIFLK